VPPKKYYRLSPGTEVRLRYAYFIRCTDVIKNEAGEVVEVHCTYDPASKGGNSPDGRKVKSTIHWVSAAHAVDCEARLYDQLMLETTGEESATSDFTAQLNPASLVIPPHAKVEPSVAGAAPGTKYQFERVGYFCVDRDSTPGRPVFNRTVKLRDSWAKIDKAQTS
jgi:glutaminyl-tRNA synthetase